MVRWLSLCCIISLLQTLILWEIIFFLTLKLIWLTGTCYTVHVHLELKTTTKLKNENLWSFINNLSKYLKITKKFYFNGHFKWRLHPSPMDTSFHFCKRSLLLSMFHDFFVDFESLPFTDLVHVLPRPIFRVCLLPKMSVLLFCGRDPKGIYINHLLKNAEKHPILSIKKVCGENQQRTTSEM